MPSVPREVPGQRRVVLYNDDKGDLYDDTCGNKQKFNEINWFAIRSKGGAGTPRSVTFNVFHSSHPFAEDEYDQKKKSGLS